MLNNFISKDKYMKLLQLAIFTNNERSINIINKFLKLKKFNINEYLTQLFSDQIS